MHDADAVDEPMPIAASAMVALVAMRAYLCMVHPLR